MKISCIRRIEATHFESEGAFMHKLIHECLVLQALQKILAIGQLPQGILVCKLILRLDTHLKSERKLILQLNVNWKYARSMLRIIHLQVGELNIKFLMAHPQFSVFQLYRVVVNFSSPYQCQNVTFVVHTVPVHSQVSIYYYSNTPMLTFVNLIFFPHNAKKYVYIPREELCRL